MSRYFHKAPDGDIILTFGKYSGRLLHEVTEFDQDYLVWILREYADDKGFDEELAVEIEEELKSRGISIEQIV